MNKTRSVWHSLSLTIVLVVKDNKPLFKNKHHVSLQGILSGICEDYSADLVSFDGHPSFVTLRVNHKPVTPGVSKFINVMKSTATRRMNRQHDELKEILWDRFYMAFNDERSHEEIELLVKGYFSAREHNTSKATSAKSISSAGAPPTGKAN